MNYDDVYARQTGAEYCNVIHLYEPNGMQEKYARLTVLIDPKMKKIFEKMCSSEEQTASHMVRVLIQQYLDQHKEQKKKREG